MIDWARFLLIGHLGLMILFVFLEAWVLIYIVSCAYFCLTFLSHSTGISQHTGLRGDIPDWRINSFTIDMSPILRFLYWNMNYHTEHHMYAGVPFYNLPKLRKKLISDLQKPMPGLLSTLACIIETHKKQREDPDYRYEPEFPPTAHRVGR
jgi:fatty acid desaturase